MRLSPLRVSLFGYFDGFKTDSRRPAYRKGMRIRAGAGFFAETFWLEQKKFRSPRERSHRASGREHGGVAGLFWRMGDPWAPE